MGEENRMPESSLGVDNDMKINATDQASPAGTKETTEGVESKKNESENKAPDLATYIKMHKPNLELTSDVLEKLKAGLEEDEQTLLSEGIDNFLKLEPGATMLYPVDAFETSAFLCYKDVNGAYVSIFVNFDKIGSADGKGKIENLTDFADQVKDLGFRGNKADLFYPSSREEVEAYWKKIKANRKREEKTDNFDF